MARDDPHGRFHAMVRDAAPHTREISVPVYTPERSSLTGKYASESRDFWAMIGIGVFCAVVPFVGFILGLAAGEVWSWLILVAVAGGLLGPFIFYRWTIHGRINAVMVAIFDVEPQPQPTDEPRFIATLPGGMPNARRVVDRPEGWTMDDLRRFARETFKDGSYNIAYGNRPDWVTEGMLDAFREWGQKKGYGRTPGERRAWVWSESGVEFMDGLRGH